MTLRTLAVHTVLQTRPLAPQDGGMTILSDLTAPGGARLRSGAPAPFSPRLAIRKQCTIWGGAVSRCPLAAQTPGAPLLVPDPELQPVSRASSWAASQAPSTLSGGLAKGCDLPLLRASGPAWQVHGSFQPKFTVQVDKQPWGSRRLSPIGPGEQQHRFPCFFCPTCCLKKKKPCLLSLLDFT